MIGSHLPITAKQARFYPSLFCFCLKFFEHPFFRQRLGWAPEPRRRFTLSGHLLFCTGLWGTRVALAIRPVRAGRFSLNLSGELAALRTRVRLRAVRGARTKRKWTPAVSTSSLNSCLSPICLARRKSESGDRSENGVRQRIFSSVGAAIGRPFRHLYAMPDSLLLHIRFTLRRRG